MAWKRGPQPELLLYRSDRVTLSVSEARPAWDECDETSAGECHQDGHHVATHPMAEPDVEQGRWISESPLERCEGQFPRPARGPPSRPARRRPLAKRGLAFP